MCSNSSREREGEQTLNTVSLVEHITVMYLLKQGVFIHRVNEGTVQETAEQND